ncbi:MAG: hypothetical protein WAX07_06935 [Candidatus Altiarchaeia archaeon]
MKTILVAVFLLLIFACYINKEASDPGCEALIDLSQKDGCYQEKGIVTGDIAYCEKIAGSVFRDRCFFYVATDSSTQSLCGRIENPNDVNHCYALVSGNDSFCAMVGREDRRDKCYYDLGSAGHVSSCGLISDGFLRDNCYTAYVYGTGDIVFCEKVSDPDNKRVCFFYPYRKRGRVRKPVR